MINVKCFRLTKVSKLDCSVVSERALFLEVAPPLGLQNFMCFGTAERRLSLIVSYQRDELVQYIFEVKHSVYLIHVHIIIIRTLVAITFPYI